MTSFVGAALVGLASMGLVEAAPQCRTVFSAPQATYDLSPLMKEHEHYFTKDAFEDAGRPFYYYFNICDDTEEDRLPLPPEDKNLCKAPGEAATAYAAAYQIINGTKDHPYGECYRLGMASDMKWNLLDEADARVGVQLVYENGGLCPVGDGTKKRSFAINFRCIEEGTSLPPVSSVEEGVEDDFCEYEVTVESIYGCPRECHQTDHSQLCSGHGVCAIDQTIGAARCFCNTGRGGDNCEGAAEPPPEGSSATSVLMTLVIILLVALLGLAAVLYIKIKRLNTEDNPYGAFEDQVPNSSLN
jgi:hypothetical protein